MLSALSFSGVFVVGAMRKIAVRLLLAILVALKRSDHRSLRLTLLQEASQREERSRYEDENSKVDETKVA